MDIIRAPGNINITTSNDSLEPLLRTSSPQQQSKPKDNNTNGTQQHFKLPSKDPHQQQHQHRHYAEGQHQQHATSGRNGLKGNASSTSSSNLTPASLPTPGSAPGAAMPTVGGGGGGGGAQLRHQTPPQPAQGSSTDSGNSSCGSGGASCSSASASVAGSGGGGSVDEPETLNQSTTPGVTEQPETPELPNPLRSSSSSLSLKNRNIYVNKTYDGGADVNNVAADGGFRSAVVSIDEGIDGCSGTGSTETKDQRQVTGSSPQEPDEEPVPGGEEEVKPLLELTNERRGRPKTKSIVKSPSNQSFGEKPARVLSLQFSQPESVIVADRPVHHVQFSNGRHGVASESGEDRALLGGPTAVAGGLGGSTTSDQMCSSPVGSILSHGSGSSSSSSGSSSSSSSNENSSLGAYAEARPPDGGWGWVVCFASFMVNLIADGVTFSFGVMYMELLSYFGEGKGKTAWVGSLFMAMPLLCGPVASFLTDRYGCRKVTIIGSILASIGFALSAYANSIEMLYLTFGILSGFGLSLCYVAAVVIVAYYFDKKRSFATGLSVCGSGIGTMVFASLTQVLLDNFGWRGTTLILAGVFLNMCLCGLLMRDLEWTTHKSKQKRRKQQLQQQQQQQQADSVSNSTNTAGNASVLNGGIVEGGAGGIGIVGGSGADGANDHHLYDLDDPRLFSSLITLPTYLQNGAGHDKIPLEVLAMLSKQHNMHDHHVLQGFPTAQLNNSRSFSEPLSPQVTEEEEENVGEKAIDDVIKEDQHEMDEQEGTNVTMPSRQRAAGGARTGARGRHAATAGGQKQHPIATTQYDHDGTTSPLPPVFLRRVHSHSTRGTAPTAVAGTTASYLKDLRMHRHSLTYRGAMLNIQRYRLRASSCPDIYRNSMTTIAKEKSAWYQGVEEFRALLVSILDFSYFSDMHYLLFAISNFLLYTFYDVPYVYLGDNATQIGFSPTQSSMLISIIGILNMVGEVFLGWMGDRKSVNPIYTYALCMALCGLVTALVPLFRDYTSLSVLAGGFGLFIAANYSLTSIILVELITLERFTNAYGLLLLVQGVANLVGPPLAGWISDLTESYDLAFYLAGFFIVISGALLLVLPTIAKVRKVLDKRRQSTIAATERR
ncbi:AGAP001782-PA-like protein [Anopheles sinensis]|uniref:AGAP001782-PA-like protein n=1 Tax=Anopheles sinensis TaxID=74873 RepID=A0A084WPC6_ANOSI|nr:AGAP001782-PA-like protein [Anopheles sinensis]